MGIRLNLEVTDPEVVAELERRPAGEERDRYALSALRIGVLSLRAAGGQIDAAAIKEAGLQLVSDVRELLVERATNLTKEMADELDKYFNAERGELSQRISSLVKDDGDLARKLKEYVGEDDSVVAKTIAQQIGKDSPIFKLLSPTDSEGLRAQVERTLQEELNKQRESILGDFDLNNERSALRRLKTNLEQILRDYELRNVDFREKVLSTLTAIATRREEEQRSTRHGGVFEEELGGVLAREAQRLGDVYEATGNTVGVIKNCKVGDFVIELGKDSATPGVRIAWEAKEDQSYDLKKALEETDTARKNRDAQVGVFVFSARTAPKSLEPFARYGDNLVLVWDAEKPDDDLYLKAAHSVARALCVRELASGTDLAEACGAILRATRAVEKQAMRLEQFRTWAETIKNNSENIIKDARVMRDELDRQIAVLDQQLAALKAG